ncbi:MAG: TolC family protein [Chitinophagaceae bacterium]
MKIFVLTGMLCIGFGLAATPQPKSLEYFIQAGLQNSPLLKDYNNQVLINQLDSQRIRATYKPQVNGTSVSLYAPVIRGYGYDGAITNGGQFTALVGFNQTLVGRKYLDAQFGNLQILSQALQNTASISEQDLKRTIIAQYITAYGDAQELKFGREVNTLLRKEEDLLKALTKSNVYRQTDYLTFLVTRQQQELSVRQLEIQLQNDYATLNYLSGIVDTSQAVLADPAIGIQALPDISQSVYFRKFMLDSLQLSNSRSLIDYNYKPKVNLFADAGYNSSFAYRAYRNFGTSFGVSIIVPIYDGHQKKIQQSKLSVSERTRLAYRDFYKKQYSQQVAQLLQQLHQTNLLIGEIDHQIKYAEGLINVNIKLLETGDAKIADLVIAINNYMNAKNLLTQNNSGRLQIINQINYWNR